MTAMSESVIHNTDTKKSLIWVPLQKPFKTDTWAAWFSEAEHVSLYLYQSKTEEKEWWTRGTLFAQTRSQTLPRIVHLCLCNWLHFMLELMPTQRLTYKPTLICYSEINKLGH